MSDKDYALITFKSTHAAMAAQRCLGDIKFKVCPVLRMISASCGISLRISAHEAEKAKILLTENNMREEMFDIYLIYFDDNCQKFKKM